MVELSIQETNQRSAFEALGFKYEPNLRGDCPRIPRTILIVEDHVGWRLILKYLLQDYCDEIATYATAEEGFEHLSKFGSNVSLILSDIDLPGISGFEFLDKIKCNPIFSKIPVILQTGRGEVSKAKALLLGASGFLSKPFQKELLYSAIENVLKLNSTNTSSEGLNASFSFKGSRAQKDCSTGEGKEHFKRSNKSKIGGQL